MRWFRLLALTLAIAAFVATRLVRRYVVEGRSMLPDFAPGDRLVAESVSLRFRPPGTDEVVVLRQPGTNGRLDLKRVYSGPGTVVNVRGEKRLLFNDEWFVVGDNMAESTDSRQLGPVATHDIVGRVWFRY